MAINPFTWVNRRGSAAVQSTGVTVNADNVVFAFANHAFATKLVSRYCVCPSRASGSDGYDRYATGAVRDKRRNAGCYEVWRRATDRG